MVVSVELEGVTTWYAWGSWEVRTMFSTGLVTSTIMHSDGRTTPSLPQFSKLDTGSCGQKQGSTGSSECQSKKLCSGGGEWCLVLLVLVLPPVWSSPVTFLHLGGSRAELGYANLLGAAWGTELHLPGVLSGKAG